MQSDYNTLSEIQSEVLGYLQQHPNAADTAEGIRQWWLLKRLAMYSQEKVQRALDELRAEHLIESCRMNNGNEVYSLSRSSHCKTSQSQ
ncbi:MAG: hypothetical protein ABFS24_04025 [Pseudomonadota bacterium]